jgi:hypothetical protein
MENAVRRPFPVLALAAVLPLALLAGCQTVSETLNPQANVGPCPSVAVLFDASRLVEINGPESWEAIGFTGEVKGVRSGCRYTDDNPITMQIEIDFALGRGQAAAGDTKRYDYFVSVTRRNIAVIEQASLSFDVTFVPGQDTETKTVKIDEIVIPRATPDLIGTNFEVLVGFELTPEQVAWNREEKRFVPRLKQG